jgi:hypothetical protein
MLLKSDRKWTLYYNHLGKNVLKGYNIIFESCSIKIHMWTPSTKICMNHNHPKLKSFKTLILDSSKYLSFRCNYVINHIIYYKEKSEFLWNLNYGMFCDLGCSWLVHASFCFQVYHLFFGLWKLTLLWIQICELNLIPSLNSHIF